METDIVDTPPAGGDQPGGGGFDLSDPELQRLIVQQVVVQRMVIKFAMSMQTSFDSDEPVSFF